MSYRIENGFAFNRAGLSGLDDSARRGVLSFIVKRERAINTIETERYICAGGPWHGEAIELATVENECPRTADVSVGAWVGFYRVVRRNDASSYSAAVWHGNDAPDSSDVAFYCVPEVKATKPAPAKGYATLTDAFIEPMIVDMPEIVRNYDSAVGYSYSAARVECAVFTIGSCMLRCLNTPEAIDRLKAKVLKAKKWFSDKAAP